MPSNLTVVTVKLPNADLRRIPAGGKRSAFIRAAVAEKLTREGSPDWKPKTPFGRRLLALSDRYQGERLSPAEIAEEMRERRGTLD